MTEVTLVSIDQLPAWATEKTLNSLVRYLKENKGMDESTAKKLSDAVDNLGKNTKETSEKLEEVADELGKVKDGGADTGPRGAPKEETKKTEKQMGVFRSTLRGLTSDSADLAKSLISNVTGFESSSRYLYGFNRAIEDATKESGKLKKALGSTLMGAVGIAASAFGMLVKVIMDSANVMLKMNEVGLRGITTSEQLNRNLVQLAMTSSEFQDIMSRFSTVMGTFGETALADLIGSSTEFNDSLSKLGLTTADAAEFAAEYLQQQRLAGVFERVDNYERRKAFNENLRELSAFSTMLNVSRRDIARAQTQMLAQDRIRAVLLSETDERVGDSIRSLSGFFAGFGKTGEAVNEMFGDMVSVADPTMALANYSTAFSAAPEAITQFMGTVRDIRSGALKDDEEVRRRGIQFNMLLAEDAERLSRIAQLTGDQFTARLASQALSQREFIRRNKLENATREEIEEALMKRAQTESDLAATSAEFSDTVNRMRRVAETVVLGIFGTLFSKDNADGATDAFEGVLKSITNFGKGINEFFIGFFDDEARKGESFGTMLSNLFSEMWSQISESLLGEEKSFGEWVRDSIRTAGSSLVDYLIRKLTDWSNIFVSMLSRQLNAAIDRIPFARRYRAPEMPQFDQPDRTVYDESGNPVFFSNEEVNETLGRLPEHLIEQVNTANDIDTVREEVSAIAEQPLSTGEVQNLMNQMVGGLALLESRLEKIEINTGNAASGINRMA